METPIVNVEELMKKIIEERKAEEKRFHQERVNKLVQEKIELELRLLVITKSLENIEEYVRQNPHLQE